MAGKPMMLFAGGITSRVFATKAYKEYAPDRFEVTGQKHDVTKYVAHITGRELLQDRVLKAAIDEYNGAIAGGNTQEAAMHDAILRAVDTAWPGQGVATAPEQEGGQGDV